MTQINMDDLSAAARLALTEDEKKNLAKDVASILSLGSALCQESDEAFFHNDTPDLCSATGSLRADEPQESLPRDVLLSLAPTSHDGFVTVPRVIADGKRDEKKEGGTCV